MRRNEGLLILRPPGALPLGLSTTVSLAAAVVETTATPLAETWQSTSVTVGRIPEGLCDLTQPPPIIASCGSSIATPSMLGSCGRDWCCWDWAKELTLTNPPCALFKTVCNPKSASFAVMLIFVTTFLPVWWWVVSFIISKFSSLRSYGHNGAHQSYIWPYPTYKSTIILLYYYHLQWRHPTRTLLTLWTTGSGWAWRWCKACATSIIHERASKSWAIMNNQIRWFIIR